MPTKLGVPNGHTWRQASQTDTQWRQASQTDTHWTIKVSHTATIEEWYTFYVTFIAIKFHQNDTEWSRYHTEWSIWMASSAILIRCGIQPVLNSPGSVVRSGCHPHIQMDNYCHQTYRWQLARLQYIYGHSYFREPLPNHARHGC